MYVFQGYKVIIQNFEGKSSTIFKILYWVVVALAYACLAYTTTHMRSNPMTFWTKVTLSYFFIFLMIQLVWGLFMAIDDVVRVIQWIGTFFQSNAKSEGGITRKSFLMKSGALVATGFGAALSYGVIRGSHHYQVVNHTLTIDPTCPEPFKGLKLLVQISDIHSGSFWSKEAVQKGIELVKAQEADMVFFTGDIVNNDASEMDDYIDAFAQITAPLGVYATMGNHDYGEYVPDFRPETLAKEYRQNSRST